MDRHLAETKESLRFRIDATRCDGQGVCVLIAPEIFELDRYGDAYVLPGADEIVANDPDVRARGLEADAMCPRNAIYELPPVPPRGTRAADEPVTPAAAPRLLTDHPETVTAWRRPGRKGKDVAEWVLEKASARTAAKYELVDLADYPLPHLDEVVPPSLGQYSGEHTKAWAAKIASYDGFIFVTPEYNHSTSGVLKNAIDYLYGEWNNKAAAFVSYGSLGGARAIEHLRAISSELQIAHVRQQLSFSLFTDFENFSVFKPAGMHDAASDVLFDQLESWADALKPIRV